MTQAKPSTKADEIPEKALSLKVKSNHKYDLILNGDTDETKHKGRQDSGEGPKLKGERYILRIIFTTLNIVQTIKNASKQKETNIQAEDESEKQENENHCSDRSSGWPVLDSVLEPNDELEVLSESEGPINIPEDSVFDTESSDGLGHVYEDESDGDHEKDEDFVMDNASGSDKSHNLDSDEDFYADEAPCEPMKGKGKVIKVSYLTQSSVTVLKLAGSFKNRRKATSAEILTMPAPIQPSQGTQQLQK